MIDYISGPIAELNPTYAVIDCGGIGYEINISLVDYSTLLGKRETKLYIHESIREDAHVLYGFCTKRSRELFRLVIGVSGVGPNTGRLILSSLTSDQLEAAISSGNDKMLKGVKGIGAKTAQRIIVDLRDKIKSSGAALSTSMAATTQTYDEALAGLLTLGFAAAASQKVLNKLFAQEPDITTEQAIKKSLKML